MNMKVGFSGKINMQMWGRGKDAEGLRALKYAMCIYIRQINESHKHCLKNGERREGKWK
jgi:hypothetical protein